MPCHKGRVAIAAAMSTLLLASAFANIGQTEPLRVVASEIYSRPAQLIPVMGKRRLNLVCMGTDSPVVLFEAGAGGGAPDWRKVQAEVAKVTRACAYDRAGYGYSDPIDRPVDAINVVADFHQMLKGASLDAPIVLVGHSVGGIYSELFAATYPSQVAGLVLVDPTGLEDFGLINKVLTEDERAQQKASHLRQSATYARCLQLAKRGKVPVSAGSECAAPQTDDPVMNVVLQRQYGDPKRWETFQSAMRAFYPSDDPLESDSVTTSEVRAQPLALGDKPLILLKTPGRVPPGERGEWLRSASLASARKLVTASTRGRVVEVDSGHYIQFQHPDVVIDTVLEVVGVVRAAR